MSRATPQPLRVLAFEPFDSGSHRAVRESITRHSRHDWTWITRPAIGWKWRMRLAVYEMLEDARARGELDRSPDLIFATSLMSTADLRAMAPAALRSCPLVLYMHENQAVYPAETVRFRSDTESATISEAPGGPPDVQFALTNLTSILAADSVIWNSAWNQRSFIEGLGSILRHAPDPGVSVQEFTDRIMRKSEVIWPPVELPPPPGSAPADRRVLHNSTLAQGRGEHADGVEDPPARPENSVAASLGARQGAGRAAPAGP